MNTDSVNEPLRGLYDLLGQMQELLKIFSNDFKVQAKELDFSISLPQNKIDELKARYTSLQEDIVRKANAIPRLERLG